MRGGRGASGKGPLLAIPLKDSLLVPWSANFDTRANATPLVFGLTAAQANDYTTLHTPYVAAYNAMMEARADGSNSKALTAARTAAKDALLAYARELYAFVSANTSVSDENKILLGVHVRSGGNTPVPAPTERPGMHVEAVVERTIELTIHDSASSTKRGKPAGAVQALVYYFAGEDYPSDPNGWSFAGVATKRTFAFTVPDSVAGGTRVWVCAAWTNRVGDPGPVNVPISVNVQGGGSATADPGLKMAA